LIGLANRAIRSAPVIARPPVKKKALTKLPEACTVKPVILGAKMPG